MSITNIIVQKACLECGSHFERQAREAFIDFEQRRYCSRACSDKNSWTKKQTRKQFPPKVCPVCNKEFNRNSTENANDYRKRKYCSPFCYRKVSAEAIKRFPKKPRTVLEPKTCPICQKSFSMRKNEQPSYYKQRMFCSRSCARKGSHTYYGNRKWSSKEDNIVKSLYSSLAKTGLKKLLPHRSEKAIKYRASMLGVKLPPDMRFKVASQALTTWTKEEDDILRKHYPESGSEKLTLLLSDRTERSVGERARHLGIKMTKNALRLLKREAAVQSICRRRHIDYVPSPEELRHRISLIREKKVRDGSLPDGAQLARMFA